MFKQVDSLVDRKWTAGLFNKFYDKNWVGFCLNTGWNVLFVKWKVEKNEKLYLCVVAATIVWTYNGCP